MGLPAEEVLDMYHKSSIRSLADTFGSGGLWTRKRQDELGYGVTEVMSAKCKSLLDVWFHTGVCPDTQYRGVFMGGC